MENEIVEATRVCVENIQELPTWARWAFSGLGTIAGSAILANKVGKTTFLGKIINWLGGNFTVEKKVPTEK